MGENFTVKSMKSIQQIASRFFARQVGRMCCGVVEWMHRLSDKQQDRLQLKVND